MKEHRIESEGHNCYQAIRDKGFQNLDLSNKRICGDLAKVDMKSLITLNIKLNIRILDCVQIVKEAME